MKCVGTLFKGYHLLAYSFSINIQRMNRTIVASLDPNILGNHFSRRDLKTWDESVTSISPYIVLVNSLLDFLAQQLSSVIIYDDLALTLDHLPFKAIRIKLINSLAAFFVSHLHKRVEKDLVLSETKNLVVFVQILHTE